MTMAGRVNGFYYTEDREVGRAVTVTTVKLWVWCNKTRYWKLADEVTVTGGWVNGLPSVGWSTDLDQYCQWRRTTRSVLEATGHDYVKHCTDTFDWPTDLRGPW